MNVEIWKWVLESWKPEFEFQLSNWLIIYPKNIFLAFLGLRITYITLKYCEKSYK